MTCSRLGIAAALLCVALIALPGCGGRKDKKKKKGGDDAQVAGVVKELPTYELASDLRASYPAVAAFVDQFVQTCLTPDYPGYRRLVSRDVIPESQARFEAIYNAVRSVRVETIEPLEIDFEPLADMTVHLVICAVEFDPGSRIRLRERGRRIGLLVFEENGALRMRPAPSELQPREPVAPTTTSAPATTRPAFPWDEDVDS